MAMKLKGMKNIEKTSEHIDTEMLLTPKSSPVSVVIGKNVY